MERDGGDDNDVDGASSGSGFTSHHKSYVWPRPLFHHLVLVEVLDVAMNSNNIYYYYIADPRKCSSLCKMFIISKDYSNYKILTMTILSQ